VTLTGVAKNAAEVNRAIDDIKRVDGVVSVKNATPSRNCRIII